MVQIRANQKEQLIKNIQRQIERIFVNAFDSINRSFVLSTI